MSFIQSMLVLLGRICFAALFLWAALTKIVGWNGTLSYMASKHIPYPGLFLAGAICLLIVGSIFLLLGYRARLGACLLIIFIVPAMCIFHDFWNLNGSARLTEQIMFMKDVAILGGLLTLAAFGPGRFALNE